MRVWLVQTGEQIPADGQDSRYLRTVNLAIELSQRGHEVVYITSSMNHQLKVQRENPGDPIRHSKNLTFVQVYGRHYAKNVSISRIMSHRDNARNFATQAPAMPPPDFILCGYPPIELADSCVRFAKARGIPLAVDCRDLWPEIIHDRIPSLLKPAAWPLTRSWDAAQKRIFRDADLITGITDEFVEWAVGIGGRNRTSEDRAFHLTVSPEHFTREQLDKAGVYWDEKLGDCAGKLIGCYAGGLASRLDLHTALDGLDLLHDTERSRIRIVFCGRGDLADEVALRAKRNPAIVAGGWRSGPELRALMARSHFGLLAYPNSRDYLMSYPNKVGEFLSAGLPIMTGLNGLTGNLLDQAGVRLSYLAGSPESFAQKLREIDSDRLQAMRGAAKGLGEANFAPAQIYSSFADWIEQHALAPSSTR